MKPLLFIIIFFCPYSLMYSQVVNPGMLDTMDGEKIKNITIGGYIDAYYGYYSGQTQEGNIPYFVTMDRHNEITVNLAYIDIRYQADRVRGRLIPGLGTYIQSNYQSEPDVLKNIVEATIGYRLFQKKQIWLDIGVLGSPYTNESAVSKDHLMYTRSFAPEYVPYYLSGAKLTVPLTKSATLYLYLLNGWQQIQDLNKGKSLGTQIEFRPDAKNLINWNTYIGSETTRFNPGFTTRFFTDIYWIYNPDKRWSMTSCVYAGIQNFNSPKTLKEKLWWQYNLMARYTFHPKMSLSARIEYFSDPNGIQIVPVTGRQSFSSFSTGACINYGPAENILLRLEGRYFFSGDSVFLNASGEDTSSMAWFVSGATLWF